ncbi:10480_t:CDS:2 [Ambispora leptoticha]|uniref:10480_t:CDS:1 n=1 Tax=Ambispora leptoticha TaxID=144679 RepID=A0A9N9A3Y5_9GLOM|nr:10480_t:CDS:2 [Ambispora leptoticha]
MRHSLVFVNNFLKNKKSLVTIIQRKNFPISRRYMIPTGSHVSNNDPNVMQVEKEKLLKGKIIDHIKSAPGWSETLASESEAIVKAEREDGYTIEEIQHHTLKILHEEENKN